MNWKGIRVLVIFVSGIFFYGCAKRETIQREIEKPEEFKLPTPPVVWPSKEISIRVGLGEFKELYLYLDDSFYIYEGSNLKFQGTNTALKVNIYNAVPAQFYYYTSYGDFETMSEALEKARELADLGISVKVKEIGRTFKTKKGTISSVSYLVYQGPYLSQSEALKKSLPYRKVVFKELKNKPHGKFKLTFGERSYNSEGILRIVSKSPMKVLNFEKKDHYSGGSGQRSFLTTGILEIRPSNSGKLQLVNELPLETYLEGVLKGEVPSTFYKEALKAQVVAARTNALSALGKKLSINSEPYDVTADIFTQNFEGFNDDSYFAEVVKATKGEVLTYEGKLITVFYFSSCGGSLASSEEIFGKDLPYYSARRDNFTKPEHIALYTDSEVKNFIENPPPASCNYSGNRYYRWERTISAMQLSLNIKRKFGKDVGNVRNVKITKRGPSGRSEVLFIEGENGSFFVEGDFEIRRALDVNMLPSSLIYIVNSKDMFIIRGAGFGHGVGMCQFGSSGLAQKGKNYKEILNFYYPGTEIEKIY